MRAGPVFSVGEILSVQDNKEVKQVSSFNPAVKKKKINKTNSVTLSVAAHSFVSPPCGNQNLLG